MVHLGAAHGGEAVAPDVQFRGEQHPGSDVDILVQFEPGQKSFDNFIGLAELLEELLHRRVELVTREGLSPYIGPRILADVEDVPLDE